MVALGVAAIGAVGTIISAWLVVKVRHVQETVNGHTEKLEARIDALQAQLDSRVTVLGSSSRETGRNDI